MPQPPSDWEQWIQEISRQLKQFQTATQHLSKKSVLIDQWVRAFYHIADTLQSTEKIQETQTHLATNETLPKSDIEKRQSNPTPTITTSEPITDPFSTIGQMTEDVTRSKEE